MNIKPRVYLTIDDSPSPVSAALVGYVASLGIPAFYFCVGARLEQDMAPMVEAVRQGGILANHSYSHRPSSQLSVPEWIEETERTERLIDAVYQQAGRARHGYFYRFPYCDRGDGDKTEQRLATILADIQRGQGVSLPNPEPVAARQAYLRDKGYVQPFPAVNHPLYEVPDVRGAADCLCTYSTADWMLTARHLGRHGPLTIQDLTERMEADPWLFRTAGAHVVLLHDQPDIGPVTTSLVRYMVGAGCDFLGV